MKVNRKPVSKWYLHIIIILFLACVGTAFFVHYIAYSDFSLTILSYNHPPQVFKNIIYDELLGDQSLKGEFIAKDDYMGIVGIRFNTFERKNEDKIVFRIKEAGSNNWYVQQNYRTTFADEELYFFGFPIIEDSRGKMYIFEILSLQGKPGNAVALSKTEPMAVTKYKYPKAALLKNKSLILSFLQKKLINELQNVDVFFFLPVFFLPLVWYTVKATNKKRLMDLFFGFSLTLIVIDILYVKKTLDESLLILVAALYVSIQNKSRATIFFWLGFVILITTALLYAGAHYDKAIKSASWAFIFLTEALIATSLALKKGKLWI